MEWGRAFVYGEWAGGGEGRSGLPVLSTQLCKGMDTLWLKFLPRQSPARRIFRPLNTPDSEVYWQCLSLQMRRKRWAAWAAWG